MIEFLSEGTGKVLGVKATGTLTNADYKDVLIPRLEKMFAEFGRLRILFYMDEGFTGWDLSAAWDDAAIALKPAKCRSPLQRARADRIEEVLS